MAETWIRLLGPPRIESPGTTPAQPKGRKAWAVLAYLALQPDGISRSRTATLLFPDAADPLGALRWNLSELRRTLDGVSITGDPLRLALLPSWHCDALELVGSATGNGLDPRRFDGQLMEGLTFADSAELYHRELGLPLPAEVRRALSDSAPAADPELHATAATVRSYLDAGSASLSAGAVDRGLDQLRLAVVLAQRTADRHLVAESLVTLAGALIHQAGGRGAEVADVLHRALSAEAPDGVSRTAAAALRELGYLSVQRGVPDRAAGWLERAMQAARGIPEEQARILAIQGMLASDTAHYGDAVAAFAESRRLARAVRNRRQQAFSEALLGRVHLLRGDLELAAAALDRALDGVAAEHWTAFEPFVAGVRGETYLAAGRLDAAADLIDRSWVMAELAGDH